MRCVNSQFPAGYSALATSSSLGPYYKYFGDEAKTMSEAESECAGDGATVLDLASSSKLQAYEFFLGTQLNRWFTLGFLSTSIEIGTCFCPLRLSKAQTSSKVILYSGSYFAALFFSCSP